MAEAFRAGGGRGGSDDGGDRGGGFGGVGGVFSIVTAVCIIRVGTYLASWIGQEARLTRGR